MPVSLTLVSQSQTSQHGDSYSLAPSISANGNFAVFQSFAHNLTGGADANPMDDILVKNLNTGAVVYASTNAAGEQANAGCTDPTISADGTKVAFLSGASNLVSAGAPAGQGLFVKNLTTHEIVCVAQNASNPCLSSDGQYVIFSTAASLTSSDTHSGIDIYRLRSDGTGTPELVSAASGGICANGESDYPAVSSDGNFILFASTATNLATGITDGLPHYYVKDMTSGSVQEAGPDFGSSYTGSYE
jgi:Tol biopolymer transport system component